MRLWWSEGGCELEAPADGVTGVHVTIDASGASTLRDLGRPSPTRGEEPFTGLRDRVEIAAAMVRPEIIDAARLADGRVAALLDDGGRASLGIAARLLDGAHWPEAIVLATKGSRSVAWPKGLLWSKKAPRSRARKMSTKRGELCLRAAAGALAVTCQYTGVAAIFRDGQATPTLLRLPMGPGVRLHAVPTALGVLVTVATDDGAGAVIHVDDDGTILGQRAVHAPLPALPTADRRAVLFVGDEGGGSGRLHLLRLPDLAAEGPSVHIGFPAKSLALAQNGRIALADPERLVRGILGEDGLTLGAVVDLVTLIAASGEGSQPVSASPELALPTREAAAPEPAVEPASAVDPAPEGSASPPADGATGSHPETDVEAAPTAQGAPEGAAEAASDAAQGVTDASTTALTSDSVVQADEATPSAAADMSDGGVDATPQDDRSGATSTAAAAGASDGGHASSATEMEAEPPATARDEATPDEASQPDEESQTDAEATPPAESRPDAEATPGEDARAADQEVPAPAIQTDVEADIDAASSEAQADSAASPPAIDRRPRVEQSDTDDTTAREHDVTTSASEGPVEDDRAQDRAQAAADDAETASEVAAEAADEAAADAETARAETPTDSHDAHVDAAIRARVASDAETPTDSHDAHADAANRARVASDAETPSDSHGAASAARTADDETAARAGAADEPDVATAPTDVEAQPSAAASGRSAGPYTPALVTDAPSFGLALGGTPAGGWLGTVGKEFELSLRIRSTGRASRGIRLAAGGEALARGLVQLVAIVGDGTSVAFGPSEAGMRRADLPAMAIPSGVVHPFAPPPATDAARATAESALAASHVEIRVVARGIRPGGALLTLSVSALGSSAPPLRRIRPLNIR